MGDCPDGMTLDRYPNRDGNYEKDNCRWATPCQQAINKDQVDFAVGVREHCGGFQPVIMRKGNTHYLPVFDTFEDAVAARREIKEKLDSNIG